MAQDKKRMVHGHPVSGDESGLNALEHFDYQEAEVLFQYARIHGSTKFEFNHIDYTLTYNGSEGNYQVAKRKSGGWF